MSHEEAGSTDQDDPPIYDHQLALEHSGGNPAIAAELLEMMLSELPDQQQQLQSALQSSDVAKLAELAHRISGSASCCGTPALGSACRALRTGIDQHAEADIPFLVELLQDQIGALRARHSL